MASLGTGGCILVCTLQHGWVQPLVEAEYISSIGTASISKTFHDRKIANFVTFLKTFSVGKQEENVLAPTLGRGKCFGPNSKRGKMFCPQL